MKDIFGIIIGATGVLFFLYLIIGLPIQCWLDAKKIQKIHDAAIEDDKKWLEEQAKLKPVILRIYTHDRSDVEGFYESKPIKAFADSHWSNWSNQIIVQRHTAKEVAATESGRIMERGYFSNKTDRITIPRENIRRIEVWEMME